MSFIHQLFEEVKSIVVATQTNTMLFTAIYLLQLSTASGFMLWNVFGRNFKKPVCACVVRVWLMFWLIGYWIVIDHIFGRLHSAHQFSHPSAPPTNNKWSSMNYGTLGKREREDNVCSVYELIRWRWYQGQLTINFLLSLANDRRSEKRKMRRRNAHEESNGVSTSIEWCVPIQCTD